LLRAKAEERKAIKLPEHEPRTPDERKAAGLSALPVVRGAVSKGTTSCPRSMSVQLRKSWSLRLPGDRTIARYERAEALLPVGTSQERDDHRRGMAGRAS